MVPSLCEILVYQGSCLYDILARIGHFHLGPNHRRWWSRRRRMGQVGAKLFDLSGNVALLHCALLLLSGMLTCLVATLLAAFLGPLSISRFGPHCTCRRKNGRKVIV